MGIDLEALANKLRDQGENYVEVKDDRLTLYGGCAEDENDDLLCGSEWIIVDDTGDVWTGDDWPDEVMPVYPYLAIIARHLGAGQIETEQEPTDAEMQDAARTVLCGIVEATRQSNERAGKPVAADRAALVERVKADIEMFLGDWLDASYGPYDQLANLSVSAVEAAGWVPRAEPVAAPEPLSAGEIEAMARKVGDQEMRQWFRQGGGQNDQTAIVRFVLAALPERFAVPVEGA